MSFADKIKSNARFKELTLRFLMPSNEARPRWWVRTFVNPFIHKKGKGAVIRRNARLDVLPFRTFIVGSKTIIEDQACINNGMGEVIIGDNCTIGIGCILIGPVTIGNNVILAQHIVISGLNHGYTDVNIPIREQPCTTGLIKIEDNCWIGANSVITSNITIGKQSVVAAASVVTKDIPAYSIAAGNPAKVIKKYNDITRQWEKVTSNSGD